MKERAELWETKGYYKPALVEVRLWLKSVPVTCFVCAWAPHGHPALSNIWFSVMRNEVCRLLRDALASLVEEGVLPDAPDTEVQVERSRGQEHGDFASNLAMVLKKQGKLDESKPLYQRVLAVREETLGPKHPKTLASVNNLVSLLWDQGKLDEAELLFRRVLVDSEETLGPDHPRTLIHVNKLALLLKEQGKLNEAEPLFRRAVSACLYS